MNCPNCDEQEYDLFFGCKDCKYKEYRQQKRYKGDKNVRESVEIKDRSGEESSGDIDVSVVSE